MTATATGAPGVAVAPTVQPARSVPAATPSWLLPAIAHFPRLGSEPLRAAAAEDLATHEAGWGRNPLGSSGAGLVDSIRAAGLRGRGGAWFEAARKWETVLAAGPDPVVVANGAEGEALSAKDAALLQGRPHLVLDGIELAARSLGARDAYLWLHSGASTTLARVSDALAERPDSGVRIRIRTGPDHYLTGESSAVVRALSGGPALPQFRRVPAAVSGVDGRPTLLHNVETMARLAVLARSSLVESLVPAIDSSLVTVVTADDRTVTEVRPSATFGDLVGAHFGSRDYGAVLLGGYGGTWVPAARLAGLRVDNADLRASRLSLGAGIVAPLPSTCCGIGETARVVRYLADSSARQCGPCLFGLASVAETLEALAVGTAGRSERKALVRQLDEISGRGACHHPDGAVGLVRSMLEVFAEDVARHARRGSCGKDFGHLPVPGER